MLTERTKKLGANTYSLTLFGALKGQEVLVSLLRLLGPALGPLMEARAEGAMDSAVGRMLPELAKVLTNDDLEYLVQSFGSCCTVHAPAITKGPAPLLEHRDRLWSGKYLEQLQWLVWCVQENYGSFLGGSAPRTSATPPSPG